MKTRDDYSVPVWDIKGTLLGEKFEAHLAKSEGNFQSLKETSTKKEADKDRDI